MKLVGARGIRVVCNHLLASRPRYHSTSAPAARDFFQPRSSSFGYVLHCQLCEPYLRLMAGPLFLESKFGPLAFHLSVSHRE